MSKNKPAPPPANPAVNSRRNLTGGENAHAEIPAPSDRCAWNSDERYNCRTFHRDRCEDDCSCACHTPPAPPPARLDAATERAIKATVESPAGRRLQAKIDAINGRPPASDALPPKVRDLHCGPELCGSCEEWLDARLASSALQCSGCGRDFNEPLPETVVAVLRASEGWMGGPSSGRFVPQDAALLVATLKWIAAGRPGLPREGK